MHRDALLELPWKSFEDETPPINAELLVKLADGTITGGWQEHRDAVPNGVEANYEGDSSGVSFECNPVEWLDVSFGRA